MARVITTARSIWKKFGRRVMLFAKGAVSALAAEMAVAGLKQVIRGAIGAACLFA